MKSVKFKFQQFDLIKGHKLLEYHKLKGFSEKQEYECFYRDRDVNDNPSLWGMWIKSDKNIEIKLQDVNGLVTGHGMYFEQSVIKKTKGKKKRADEA